MKSEYKYGWDKHKIIISFIMKMKMENGITCKGANYMEYTNGRK